MIDSDRNRTMIDRNQSNFIVRNDAGSTLWQKKHVFNRFRNRENSTIMTKIIGKLLRGLKDLKSLL